MELERVVDFEDPRLADYANLKDARIAGDRGRFIVEGRGVLSVLLNRSEYRPESILLSERAWRTLEPELRASPPDCPVYVGDQAVLDRIVGFPIHRGILASCRRGPDTNPEELARGLLEARRDSRIIVLEGIRNLDNMGGIFRNAMALGTEAVLLCPSSCDPLYRKAIRTSMGGTLCVPFARAKNWPDLLDSLKTWGYSILALDPGFPSEAIEDIDPESVGPAAILVGTEGPGLTGGALARADRRLRIGMETGVDSLNVSVAAAIAMHRLRVDRDAPLRNGEAS